MSGTVVIEYTTDPAIRTGDGTTNFSFGGALIPMLSGVSPFPTFSVQTNGDLEWFAAAPSLNGTLKLEGKMTATYPGDGSLTVEIEVKLTAVTAVTMGGGGINREFGIGTPLIYTFAAGHSPATVEVSPQVNGFAPSSMAAGEVASVKYSVTITP